MGARKSGHPSFPPEPPGRTEGVPICRPQLPVDSAYRTKVAPHVRGPFSEIKNAGELPEQSPVHPPKV